MARYGRYPRTNDCAERRMVKECSAILESLGIRFVSETSIDGGCHSPRVDLAFLQGSDLVVVEFKRSLGYPIQPGKSVRQAGYYKVAGDLVFLCSPDNETTDRTGRLIREGRIGLLEYTGNGSWPFEELVACPPNLWYLPDDRYRNYLLERMMS